MKEDIMRKEIEVMQVLRLPPLGKLVVSVNNTRYEKISELGEGNKKRLLLAAIGELVDFAGGYQELVNAGVAPMIKQVPVQDDGTFSTSSELGEQQKRFLANLEAERNAIRNAASSKPNISVFSGRRPSPSAANSNQIDNLVEQIDLILQKYLQEDPEMANHSIHLMQSPAGGLQIKIDGELFQRPREIQNKKIQLMIKQALKEWESR
jgi:hypothetical protein